MILGLNVKLSLGDLYCPVGSCRQKVGVFALNKDADDKQIKAKLIEILDPLKMTLKDGN